MIQKLTPLKFGIMTLAIGAAAISFAPNAYAQQTLEQIVASEHRAAENSTRDEFRHPVETLKFFDIQPNHTVVEISPGGGWYTEILGPYLKDEGTLYLTTFAEDSPRSYAAGSNKTIKDLTANKELFGAVNFAVLETPDHINAVAPAASADRVLTFRNVHNWMSDEKAAEVFAAFYDALKPGGILGVVEHRAKTDTDQDPKAESGYVRQDYVIKLAEEAGFEFVEASEINANPKDTTVHPNGVWTLPPRLRAPEGEEETFRAIGESDRMTLKFMKPAAE